MVKWEWFFPATGARLVWKTILVLIFSIYYTLEYLYVYVDYIEIACVCRDYLSGVNVSKN
jgi:hypothetical protein